LEDKTKAITTASGELKSQHSLTVQSVGQELTTVNDATTAYGKWRDNVDDTKRALVELANYRKDQIQALS
jgi:hypothetical protein